VRSQAADIVKGTAKFIWDALPPVTLYDVALGNENSFIDLVDTLTMLAVWSTPPMQVYTAVGGPDPIGDMQRAVVASIVSSAKRDGWEFAGRVALEAALFAVPAAKTKLAAAAADAGRSARVAEIADLVAYDQIPGWKGLVVELFDLREPTGGRLGMGTNVDELVEQSRSLTEAITSIQRDGWTIKFGPFKQSYARQSMKEIAIDSRSKRFAPARTATLAHEVGHAVSSIGEIAIANLERAEYVARAVANYLAGEGDAVLFSVRVRNEIEAASGTILPISGLNTPEAIEAARQFTEGNMTLEQARDIIGNAARNAHPSGAPKMTYEEVAKAHYDKLWNDTRDHLLWKKRLESLSPEEKIKAWKERGLW
jgi:hypothetical protein